MYKITSVHTSSYLLSQVDGPFAELNFLAIVAVHSMNLPQEAEGSVHSDHHAHTDRTDDARADVGRVSCYILETGAEW